MPSDYLSIIERCYAAAPDDRAWLSELLATAQPNLDLGLGIGFTLFRERESEGGAKVVLSDATGHAIWAARASWPFLEAMRGEPYRRLFYPRKPLTLASPVVATFPPLLRLGWQSIIGLAGANDVLGLMGYPAPGWIFTMFAGVRRDREVTPKLRTVLQRIRIHVESGIRLRVCSPDSAVAVLSSAGKVLDLRASGDEQPLTECLRNQVQTIEHARLRRERTSEAALQVWTALVEGRWSLVERVDTDGQRHYLAFENAPQAQAYRALTPAEATVLDQSVQGLSGKYIAYSTGLSSPRVSEYLTSAADKLGFRSRTDLLRVAANLRASGHYHLLDHGQLTQAEQAVLHLVKQGMSNREIARARKSSVKTVTHQVASLLRKTGASGRKGLVVSELTDDKS